MDVINSIGHSISKEEIENDLNLVILANKMRLLLPSSPSQSFFRVYSLIIISINNNSETLIIHGTNSEASYIGSSICAERSALVKLRFYDNPKILKVIIVTDLHFPVAPGMLCREYLMTLCDEDSIIVLAGGNAKESNDIICTKMIELVPFPYLYRHCNRSNIIDYAISWSNTNDVSPDKQLKFKNDNNIIMNEKLQKLHKIACQYTKYDDADTLHPIRLSGCVLFDDDSIEVSWMLKGLEYGCTLDPVSQLVSIMMKYRICGNCKININKNDNNDNNNDVNDDIFKFIKKPIYILTCDQYGICHAPHGQARALLTEHGFNQLNIMIHNNDTGLIEIVTVSELTPNPAGISTLSTDSFH